MKTALTVFVAACGIAAIAPLLAPSPRSTAPGTAFPGWFAQWDGAPLRRLPLSDRERRIAEDFPGQVAQFTDGRRFLLFRYTETATRKLHPAAHCFRGAGYRLEPSSQRVDLAGNRWGCMLGIRGDEKLRICERIFNNSGATWTDVSSWYWQAAFGVAGGPWWAVTTVESASHDIL